MFCSKCGKNLTDGARFCDGCGAQVDGMNSNPNEIPKTQVQTAGNSTVNNALGTVKGFFSKDTVKTVCESAQSKGMEWLILGAVSALVYGLALYLNFEQVIESILGSTSGMFDVGLEKLFFYGLLISVGVFFLMSVTIYGAMKLVLKKEVSFTSVLNLVAAASLPMTIAHAGNIIFGYIWIPMIDVLSLVAITATAVLLYVGMQKLEKLDRSPFAAYVGVWTIVVAVIVIVFQIFIREAATSVLDGIGDIFDFFS